MSLKTIMVPLALLVGLSVAACSRQDGTDAIRQQIARGAALAEAHDLGGILALAADDVRAEPMDLDRRGIRAVLWRTFAYYGPLTILYPRPAVEMREDGGEATSRFPFLILKKNQPLPNLDDLRDDPLAWIDAVGSSADLYRLRLTWNRRDDQWRVSHARLERFTGVGFE